MADHCWLPADTEGGAKEGGGEHIMAMGVEREVDTASSFQEGVA